MWIYENKGWPNFTWNVEKLAFKLADVRHRQGRLLGRMEGLGLDLKNEAILTTLINDVVKSSAIEGEHLNRQDVRSSIAKRLGINIGGLPPTNRNVEGVVEMMLDATQNFSKSLTKERLCRWHIALFSSTTSILHPIVIGDWRASESDPMQVVSGRIGHEKVHFEAPNANQLEHEMALFLKWFEGENDINAVLKAGIAHLWFVIIHPFGDGNGRIGRAISDMALARADGTSERFYSLSTQIEFEKRDYYSYLERQQKDMLDITNWLEWFIGCLDRSIDTSNEVLNSVLFKARLWEKINSQKPINERQRLIIHKMLEVDFKGCMNNSKYAKLAKCSSDTALRDIQRLQEQDIFIKNPGSGRNTNYRLIDAIPE